MYLSRYVRYMYIHLYTCIEDEILLYIFYVYVLILCMYIHQYIYCMHVCIYVYISLYMFICVYLDMLTLCSY